MRCHGLEDNVNFHRNEYLNFYMFYSLWNRVSVVGTETKLWLGRSGCRIVADARDLLISKRSTYRHWRQHSLIFNGCQGSFPGVKWPGRQADHSPPSSDEDRNWWSYTSDPSIRLHGVDRDEFTFLYICSFVVQYRADVTRSRICGPAAVR
jgi:hypothetical protein